MKYLREPISVRSAEKSLLMINIPNVDPKLKEEFARQQAMLELEKEVSGLGFRHIAGIDEAGRGPLAGPVVAAAAILPSGVFIPGLNDSKKLSPKRREEIFEMIMELSIPYGVGEASVEEIDRFNILQASRMAMMRAIRNLPFQPDYLLIDGYAWAGIDLPHRGVVHGDALCLSIAAASIIAKVTRDRLMTELDKEYPGYGFAKHKGYPTPEHFVALARYGPSLVHRRSFNLRENQLTLDFEENISRPKGGG